MSLTRFGPEKPSINPYMDGYSIPVGISTIVVEDVTVYQGYLITVPALTELEIDKALSKLPDGDYSADKLEALKEAVRIKRKTEYPPMTEYLDGIVKGDTEQINSYISKCQEVKDRYPFPS